MASLSTKSITGASLLLLMASASALGQPTSSVVTVWCPEDFVPGLNGYFQTFASVIAVDSTATTYSVDCGLGGSAVPDSGCVDWPSVTMTAGPSTLKIRAKKNLQGCRYNSVLIGGFPDDHAIDMMIVEK